MAPLFIINFSAGLFLCGLIWVVQLLHYPFFHRLDQSRFTDHHAEHKKMITFIVLPVMVAELITSALIFFSGNDPAGLHTAGFFLVILIWMSTFFIQVPLHNKLAGGYDKTIVTRLVHTNWIRTILWTLKALVGIWILSTA